MRPPHPWTKHVEITAAPVTARQTKQDATRAPLENKNRVRRSYPWNDEQKCDCRNHRMKGQEATTDRNTNTLWLASTRGKQLQDATVAKLQHQFGTGCHNRTARLIKKQNVAVAPKMKNKSKCGRNNAGKPIKKRQPQPRKRKHRCAHAPWKERPMCDRPALGKKHQDTAAAPSGKTIGQTTAAATLEGNAKVRQPRPTQRTFKMRAPQVNTTIRMWPPLPRK